MANTDRSYTANKTFIDANVNTNGINSNTGANHNQALNYMLEGLAGKLFETTRPYKGGQIVSYIDGTWGRELWVATADRVAGAWDADDFTRITKRSEEITASVTPFTGLEAGTKLYNHNIGHVKFMIQAFDSSGGLIPLNVTAKSTTQITINILSSKANAVIYINEIEIP